MKKAKAELLWCPIIPMLDRTFSVQPTLALMFTSCCGLHSEDWHAQSIIKDCSHSGRG